MDRICVDANLVVARLIPDERSEWLEARWSQWQREDTSPFGPPLLYAEVPSALRTAVHFARISAAEGDQAFQDFNDLDIDISRRDDLHIIAWDLAKSYNQPRIYDFMYLAAAQAEGCDLWTLDRRLVNSVNLPWVRWAGEI